MWEPDPSWTRWSAGAGTHTAGVWVTSTPSGLAVVKRLRAPGTGEDPRAVCPTHVSYWRREAEVALDAELVGKVGLVMPECLRLDDDPEGVTIWTRFVEPEPLDATVVARRLGRFAAAAPPGRAWLARDLLRDRVGYAEARGGWPTLARTSVADIAEQMWQRRDDWLDRYEALPFGRSHGDPTPANFLATAGDAVIAVDWQGFGVAPVGADLGYFSLSVAEDFDRLAAAFHRGLTEGGASHSIGDVVLAARLMATYTALSRAEWALTRIAAGEGELAAKCRHPSVAPHLRVLQRQVPHAEVLTS